jgi:hypothetical protein
MDTHIYKVEFYFEGTEDDTHALRRSLAQSVADEFDINRVFGVAVCLDDDTQNAPSANMQIPDGAEITFTA